MSRDQLPVIVNDILPATEFRYFDWLELTLPMKDGDVMPITIRVSKASFKMTPYVNLRQFVVEVFVYSLCRMPTEVEFDEWYTELGTALNDDGIDGFVTVASDKLSTLFDSPTYSDLQRTNYQMVSDLFSTIFKRYPTAQERTDKTITVNAVGPGPTAAGMIASFEGQEMLRNVVSDLEFFSDVKEYSDITIVEGRTMDNVDFTVRNRDELYSVIFSETDRDLAPTKAVVGRAFYVGNEVFQSDILMIGNALFADISLSEFKVTVISDTSRQGIKVVREIGQRCARIYKGPGCDTQDPTSTCSRIRMDGVNGCISKMPAPQLVNGADDNRPSFLGVAKLASHPTEPVGIGHGGIWGQVPIDPRDHINHSPFEPFQN